VLNLSSRMEFWVTSGKGPSETVVKDGCNFKREAAQACAHPGDKIRRRKGKM
jgi:hypothetical protein